MASVIDKAGTCVSLKTQLEKFAEQTSMHGFRKIITTKKPEKRVAWAVVFLAAWSLFAYQLTSVLNKYLEYSKATTIEFSAGGAPFPAVTLCNMQSVEFYAIHKFLEYRALSSDSSAAYLERNNNSLVHHFNLLYDVIDNYSNLIEDKKSAEYAESWALFSRTSFAANMPEKVLEEISVKQDEFIVKCSYDNSDCKFTKISDPYFLNCFTFEPPNIRNTSFNKFQSLTEGIEHGFSVTLFAGIQSVANIAPADEWYVPGVFEADNPLSGSSGIRVVIHPPGTDPFPLTEGYDVPPGFQASIGIVPERRKRLEEPYGKCARMNRYKKNYVDEWYGYESEVHEPYRKISCERMCMQQQVIKECNCVDGTLPNLGNSICDDEDCRVLDKNGSVSNDINVRLTLAACRRISSIEDCALNQSCDATMVADTLKNIRCANKVINRLMTDLGSLSECNCNAPCDEFRYHVSYSLAKWPSTAYESAFVNYSIFEELKFSERFAEGKREIYEEYSKRSLIESMNDFAKINVYITDSTVLQITEVPATTITQLISEIGGQLGIWIGVSVITISEVLETLLKIATVGCRRLYGKFQSRPKEADDKTIHD